MVQPVNNEKLSKRSTIERAGRRGTLESEINIRAMMSAYYTSSGGHDIGNVTSFLGLLGGKSWEKTHHRHSPKMAKHIIKVAEDTMRNVLDKEIEADRRQESKRQTDRKATLHFLSSKILYYSGPS